MENLTISEVLKYSSDMLRTSADEILELRKNIDPNFKEFCTKMLNILENDCREDSKGPEPAEPPVGRELFVNPDDCNFFSSSKTINAYNKDNVVLTSSAGNDSNKNIRTILVSFARTGNKEIDEYNILNSLDIQFLVFNGEFEGDLIGKMPENYKYDTKKVSLVMVFIVKQLGPQSMTLYKETFDLDDKEKIDNYFNLLSNMLKVKAYTPDGVLGLTYDLINKIEAKSIKIVDPAQGAAGIDPRAVNGGVVMNKGMTGMSF